MQLRAASFLTENEFDRAADDFLEDILSEIEVLEAESEELDADYQQGVLTISIGHHGRYVLNKQRPNKQIWWSSPVSGPKRFEFNDGQWLGTRDGQEMTSLLREELKPVFPSVEMADVFKF